MNVVGQLDKFYGLETPESKDSAKWFIGKHHSLSEDWILYPALAKRCFAFILDFISYQ